MGLSKIQCFGCQYIDFYSFLLKYLLNAQLKSLLYRWTMWPHGPLVLSCIWYKLFKHFTCFSGESLSQLSLRKCFGDPNDQKNTTKYSRLVHHAVQFISELHESGWILRDICCQNLYFDSNNQKVSDVFTIPLKLKYYLYILREKSSIFCN